MNTNLLGAFMIGVGSLWLLNVLREVFHQWRHRRAMDELILKPYVTPKSLALGDLQKKRAGILAALRQMRPELKGLRAKGPTAAEGPTDLDVALTEFAAYTGQLQDVEVMIEELSR